MVVIWFRKTDLRFLEITPASNSQASPSSDPWLGAQKKSEPGELIKRDVARIDGELIGNHQFNTMFFYFKPYLAYLPMLYGIPTISTHGSPLVFHTHEAGHRRYFASGDAKTMELWLKAVQSAAMEVAIWR